MEHCPPNKNTQNKAQSRPLLQEAATVPLAHEVVVHAETEAKSPPNRHANGMNRSGIDQAVDLRCQPEPAIGAKARVRQNSKRGRRRRAHRVGKSSVEVVGRHADAGQSESNSLATAAQPATAPTPSKLGAIGRKSP